MQGAWKKMWEGRAGVGWGGSSERGEGRGGFSGKEE